MSDDDSVDYRRGRRHHGGGGGGAAASAAAALSRVHHHRPTRVPGAVLNIVLPYFNFSGSHTRPRLHSEFCERWKQWEERGDLGGTRAVVYVVEGALKDHAYEVTSASCPQHLQLRLDSAFFCKEALVNAAVTRLLPRDAEYIAVIDSDVQFSNQRLLSDTLAALQRHAVVQLFSTAQDLGPDGEHMGGAPVQSFAATYIDHLKEHALTLASLSLDVPPRPSVPAPAQSQPSTSAAPAGGLGDEDDSVPSAPVLAALSSGGAPSAASIATDACYPTPACSTSGGGKVSAGGGHKKRKTGTSGHPGYAWAYTREAWKTFGGMIAFAVTGSADRLMALGLVGAVEAALDASMSEDYKRGARAWQHRAQALGRNLGVVHGGLLHEWHGPKTDRRYTDRHAILKATGFSPDLHTVMDSEGMLQITSSQSRDAAELRLRLAAYFTLRDDDSKCRH